MISASFYPKQAESGMSVEMLKHFIFVFLCVVALTVQLVHTQSESGFISIDCGISEISGYTDKLTGINYTSDATFIETGVSKHISPEYNINTLEQQFLNVRSFPEGVKNCYTLKPERGDTKFLIRARFMYGNYDGQMKVPSFNLLLEGDVWDSVELENASTIVTKEIIHIPPKNYIYVCFVNTGSGTPFISALELRPVSNSTYQTQSGSLLLSWRWDLGLTTNIGIFRYKDDAYDRIWWPYNSQNWIPISTLRPVHSYGNDFRPPSTVMRTAVIPANVSNSLQFGWKPSDPTIGYYVYFYFAELEDSQANNETREVNMYLSGSLLTEPFHLYYLTSYIRYSISPIRAEKIDISINKAKNSSLPPMLNAFEVYREKEFRQLLTNQQDVDAIMNIRTTYGVKRNWQGDPCAPKDHLWHGLNCSYDDYNPPRIISLNLSLSGISGEISPYISSLASIQSLDLSNNSLIGPVPDFLSQLLFLTVLNLRGNKLEGSIPVVLMERKEKGLLSLSLDENPDLCLEALCREKNKRTVAFAFVPIAAAVVSVCVIITAIAILWNFKKRKQVGKKNEPLESKNRSFRYCDLERIANNFGRAIGKGGFGTVYHGYLDDTQVAVKILSQSSAQGYKQFQAEVELLMRVHHKNLTTLVGYCDECMNLGLIYEFMANGNLHAHLLEADADILSWEGRLLIAIESAQGLDYFHSGCKPPIVHRDVQSTNILLNEKFQAKLSDFGLSRIFPIESDTHVSTAVAGTPGYLDPEYYLSNRLTEKSDVYSFGVVLLEIITGKPVIQNTPNLERTHISQWVSFMLAMGDIKNIVDPRLNGDFDTNSVWKAVEIAMVCVSPTSAKRPTMNQVVMELNESLAIEVARKKMGEESEISKDSMLSINLNLDTELSPIVR